MINFKYIELYDSVGYECECCGSGYGDGEQVYINEELVWERQSDGHLGGYQSGVHESGMFLDCVMLGIENTLIKNVEGDYTEETRIAWNKAYPGNRIAHTQEAWNERKQLSLEVCKASVESLKEYKLPQSYYNALRVLAILLEDEFCMDVKLEKEQEVME